MFYFFTELYYALFTGEWTNFHISAADRATFSNNGLSLFKNIGTLIVNALGGNFASIQTFDIFEGFQNFQYQSAQTQSIYWIAFAWSFVLGLITMTAVCFAVWKIIKTIFSIFFIGWRK